jgi:hypothetical protein
VGRELESVILALGKWGSRATPVPKGELSVDALMIALETTFDPVAAEGLRLKLELRVGAERFSARVSRGQLELKRGASQEFDAAITSDASTLRQLVFMNRPLKPTEVEGDVKAARRFLELFPRPSR